MEVVDIQRAAEFLLAGEVIAYPTEAVFGLGCDPNNENAVMKLLSLKSRNKDKGLIVIGATFQDVSPYVTTLEQSLPPEVLKSWPGPNTWLLPANPFANPLLRGQFDTQAVRLSAHQVVRQLCQAFGGGIVSTSANLSHEDPAMTYEDVCRSFSDKISALVKGDLGGLNAPTLIRDAATGKTLRGV